MKEEIEEFYRGLTREFKKRNDDCTAKQRLLYPNRERDWRNSLFHSFLPSDSLYTSTKKRRERNWGKSLVHAFSSVRSSHTSRNNRRERQKLAKIIVFSLFCSSYMSKAIRREKEIGKNHCSIAFSLSRSSYNVEEDFHKVRSMVVGVEESESVISLSKLFT